MDCAEMTLRRWHFAEDAYANTSSARTSLPSSLPNLPMCQSMQAYGFKRRLSPAIRYLSSCIQARTTIPRPELLPSCSRDNRVTSRRESKSTHASIPPSPCLRTRFRKSRARTRTMLTYARRCPHRTTCYNSRVLQPYAFRPVAPPKPPTVPTNGVVNDTTNTCPNQHAPHTVFHMPHNDEGVRKTMISNPE